MAEARLKLSELADGSLKAVDLNGEDVVVARVGDRCYALGGICPHEGAPLEDGELDGETLTCPWHFTEFDVTSGKVVDGLTEEPLAVYAVSIDGDDVVVSKD